MLKKMYNLQETSIEWALLHLERFYDSDFYPRLFEFEAIKHDWSNIKSYLLNLDLDKYAPKVPLTTLAPKPNGTFRVVHQLEPLDSLIYTALVHENAGLIESMRIPEERKIACSYRIKIDLTGSFFDRDAIGYLEFIEKAEELAKEFKDGSALVCDITDFYNQIYLHRVNNILAEGGSKSSKAIEEFLSGINNNVSKGIPVGPAPSIIIAEAIMSDIDKMILKYTDKFVRYVDDIYLFFKSEDEAIFFLHQLTKFLYSNHRLTISSEKTAILPTEIFIDTYITEEERTEKQAIHEEIEEMGSGDYPSIEEIRAFDELEAGEKIKVRSDAYKKLLEQSLEFDRLDLGLVRHILRKAGRYNIRGIIPLIFKNFKKLLPAIREVVIYFDRVLNEVTVKKYEKKFEALLSEDFLRIPFINIWIFTLFQNELFNRTKINIDYKLILRTRERALIAKRQNDKTWLKEIKDGLDTLGTWDKRGCLLTSVILSEDEMKHWLGLESSRGDVLNKAVCSYAISLKKRLA